MDADIARAATTVLVTTEEIVPEEETRRYPDRTVIPGFVVDALVHVPFGSFPHECYGLYEADYDHFAEYCAAHRRARPGGRRRLSRALRLRAAHVGRLPRPLRGRAHGAASQAREGAYAMTAQRAFLRPPSVGAGRVRADNDRARLQRLRASRRDRRAPAPRRHHGLRRRRRAAPGRRARQATPRAAADDGHRGRNHRPADRAGAAADLHQRDARRSPGHDAAGHHRRVPVRPARLRRRRVHGRRADRPVRQHQHERASAPTTGTRKCACPGRAAPTTSPRCAARSSS